MVVISDNGTGEKGNGTSRSKETEQYNETHLEFDLLPQ